MTPEQMIQLKALIDAGIFTGAIIALLAIWRRIRREYKDIDDNR